MAFTRGLAGLLVLVGLAMLLPSGSAAVEIHAHRGGPNVEGEATYGENSMSAFRHSAEAGYVIEFDLAWTSDEVSVAMHDSTLNRTTNCEGEVADISWADLGSCRIDRIGVGDARVNLDPDDPRLEPVPRLSQIIDLLKETGAMANIEVKALSSNGLEFPSAVYAELAASGLPSSQVILQSFNSRILANARSIYPGVTTSRLAIELRNDAFDQMTIDTAVADGSTWLSPLWPISESFAGRARAAGLLLIPWTIDDPVEMVAAAEFGVDGMITNDPTMADRLIGGYTKPEPAPEPEPVPVPEPARAAKLEMKLLKGKTRARPGGKMFITAKIRNSGGTVSGPVRLKAFVRRAPLRLSRRWPRTLSPLGPGQSRRIKVKVRIKRGPGKAGAYRIFAALAAGDRKPVKRSMKVRVLR